MSRLEEALEEFKDEIILRGCTSEDLFLVLNIDGIDVLVSVEFEDDSFESLKVYGTEFRFFEDYEDGIDEYRGIPCDVFLEEMKNLDILSWQFEEL